MRPEFTNLLAEIQLPKLERLRIEDGAVAELDSISQLMEKHEGTLENIVVRRIDLVVPNGTNEEAASRKWEELMQSMIESRMRIRRADVEDVGFVTEDRSNGCRCRCRLQGREEKKGFEGALWRMKNGGVAGREDDLEALGVKEKGNEEDSEEWGTVWSIDYRYEPKYGYLWQNGRLL